MVAVTFVLFKELTELLGVRVAGHTRVGKFEALRENVGWVG